MLNVENGPGANGLRGGIKAYSAKVTTGQWLDTCGGPMGYKRGFTTSNFETEAQHAQLGVVAKAPGFYGAGIKIADQRDQYGNDTLKGNAEQWTSTMKGTHPDFSVMKRDPNDYELLQPRMTREALLAYRKKWTCDSENNRKIRYHTESRMAANQLKGMFNTVSLRSLPGTPNSLEQYRNRVVERYGIFALCAIKLHFGVEPLSSFEFKAKFKDVGVAIKPYELSQILAYITPSTVGLSVKEMECFHLTMKGHLDGFSAQEASNVFFNITGGEEDVSVPIDQLADGFTTFLPAYTTRDSVTVEEFVAMHDDMYSCSPEGLLELLSSGWIA
jgi:hypothetical protein